jgi:anti-sigma B factor antagonist
MAGVSEILGGEAGVPHGRLAFLRWSRQSVDGVVVVRPAGELDLSTAAEFRRLLSIAQSGTAATIVLDMSDVSFIDAHSLGLIVGASAAAEGRGRVLRVDGLHGLPARVFRLTGLEPMLARRGCGDTGGRKAGG